MNLFLSIKSFIHVLGEDFALSKMGVPRGWLLSLHYAGRYAEHTRRVPPLKEVVLLLHSKKVRMQLSALYIGAFKGVFLDHEYRCDHLLSRLPLRIVDAGANIGMGAVYLNTLFPGAEFICVEPDPRNLPLLQINLQANQIQAKVDNVAVAAQSGKLNLRFGVDPTCSALETSPMHELEDNVQVVVKTMVELLDSAGWEYVDLLKIDIEGVEDELLSTNNQWLHRISALILEIHPNTTPDKIASYLLPFGFQLVRVGHGAEPVYFASRLATSA